MMVILGNVFFFFYHYNNMRKYGGTLLVHRVGVRAQAGKPILNLWSDIGATPAYYSTPNAN